MRILSVSSLAAAFFLPKLVHSQTQTYFTNSVNERAIACPLDPNQIGYKHVTDIVVDQETELERVARGEAPRKNADGFYIFPLCNNFKFLMVEEILQVLLDDVKFVCGYNGKSEELCVLEGGEVQVVIPDNSANKNVHFEGISFWGFEGISTHAYGAGSSKITFKDVHWHNFYNGATAVRQWLPPQGGVPMEVEVEKATFRNGTGSDLFINEGGVLRFTDMTIVDTLRVDSMIRTSARGTSNLANVQAHFAEVTVSLRRTNCILHQEVPRNIVNSKF